MDQTNYDQPHLVTHEATGHVQTNDRRRTTITAFLCVYAVSRQYGGPQEGGWYFDGYEFTGAAFPFRCEQEFEARELDVDEWKANEDHGTWQCWYDDEEGKYMAWAPVGLPHVVDEPTRVRLESARLHFIDMYGDPDAKEKRHSVLSGSRGVDVAFVYELQPGERGERPRPVYC